MKMQFLALGAKCGGRGASGLIEEEFASAASNPSCCKSEATASMPAPQALVARKLRRDWRMWSGRIMYFFSKIDRSQYLQYSNADSLLTRREVDSGRVCRESTNSCTIQSMKTIDLANVTA